MRLPLIESGRTPWTCDTLDDDMASVIEQTGARDTVLVSSVLPFRLKTADNPAGTELAAVDKTALALQEDRPKFLAGFFRTLFGVDTAQDTAQDAVSDELLAGARSAVAARSWAAMATEPRVHREPSDLADRFALGSTRLLRFFADTLFAKRYGHRAIVLETVAAVPGMVGAMATHLQCLRRMVGDDGWIRTLMEEAENERMHLMTFIEVARPTALERILILVAQWAFYVGFFLLYLVSRRTAHRLVGYFEEEAVLSYTQYLAEIDAGRAPNVAAPAIARKYWKLADDATLRDVVLVVRADEAHHRDVNHGLANQLAGLPADPAPVAPYPEHADSDR